MTEAEKNLRNQRAPLSHAQCIELAELIEGLRAKVAELEATRCQEDHLHPDWSKLEATRGSLRDGWKREKRLQAVLAREVMAFDGDLMRCRLCSTELSIFSSEPHPHAESCPLAFRDGPLAVDEEIVRLAERCKASVHITFNNHRTYYEQLGEAMKDVTDLDPAVLAKCIELDSMVSVQFYPDTPIGSYTVHHHDLAAAILEAHAILDNPR